MFEDEGSSRRRPRGFRKKQLLKNCGTGGNPYYQSIPVGFEGAGLPGGADLQPYAFGQFSGYEYPPTTATSVINDNLSSYPTMNAENMYSRIGHYTPAVHHDPSSSPPNSQNPTTIDYSTYQPNSAVYNPSPYSTENGTYVNIFVLSFYE